MTRRENDSVHRGGCAMLAVMGLASVCIPLLIFLPLLLSLVEHYLFGTDHVYELCERMGIADGLETIYEPVIRLVRSLFN